MVSRIFCLSSGRVPVLCFEIQGRDVVEAQRHITAGGGYSRLVNVRTGRCADVEGGSRSDGARVIEWPANTGTNQQWQIVDG